MTGILEWLRTNFRDKNPKWSRMGEAANEIELLRENVMMRIETHKREVGRLEQGAEAAEKVVMAYLQAFELIEDALKAYNKENPNG